MTAKKVGCLDRWYEEQICKRIIKFMFLWAGVHWEERHEGDKHSEVFTSSAHQRRDWGKQESGGEQLQREVMYKGVLSSSVMYISSFQDFNILILLMRTAAASVACGLLGARLVLGLEEGGAGGLCHQASEGSAGGVSVPSVWQSCSLSCQRLSWVWWPASLWGRWQILTGV